MINPEKYLQAARVAIHPAQWTFMELRYVLCLGFLALVVLGHAVVQKLTHLRVQPPYLTLKGPFYARYIPLEQIEWVYIIEDITRFQYLFVFRWQAGSRTLYLHKALAEYQLKVGPEASDFVRELAKHCPNARVGYNEVLAQEWVSMDPAEWRRRANKGI